MRYLLLSHIIPPLPSRVFDGIFLGRARQIFHGPVRVGQDGDFLSLPPGTTDIRRVNRLKAFQ